MSTQQQNDHLKHDIACVSCSSSYLRVKTRALLLGHKALTQSTPPPISPPIIFNFNFYWTLLGLVNFNGSYDSSIFIFLRNLQFFFFLEFTLTLVVIFISHFWLCWVFVAASVFSSYGEQRLLSSSVLWLLIVVASLGAEHRLVVEAHGLISCSSWTLEQGLPSCGAWA